MIKVVIKRNSKGKIVGFSINGHAGFAKHGEDIVCAAVSVLAQTAVIGIHDYAKVNCQFNIDDGKLECKIPCDISNEKRVQTDAILETMALGLKNIKEGYSSYIKIKEEEV
ncbi:ribosomal-processing cysteine protease Prp [Tepidibacter formicigenes]|jgi:uncharacterized protein YsxB (DUF464 family)|uniref:Ribosomal processing cysteine protease Prp n=1 Tax=Tepidibacter formicigenes DSM 15518 TaxID=1123349 RepID=A0A1M6JYW8_9FIRM|nr:ribosomal-processing cysteine protease Prp [Tepidibacter formicigenes]SHJ51875.1 hypothetical protein SAMN02744037_00224 [Tepidibacter formicigenes DSM 15518]